MAGSRPPVRPIPISRRVLLSAFFTLLSLFSIVSFLSSSSSSSDHSSSPPADHRHHRRSFLSLPSDPLLSRVDLLRRHASGHHALASAYASHSLRLKLDHSRLLRQFTDLQLSLSALLPRLDPDSIPDEDALRPLEKEAKDRIKIARQLVSESKESFDTQLKIHKLQDTVLSARDQLIRAHRLRTLSGSIAAASTPKSLHCLALRLLSHPLAPKTLAPIPNLSAFFDPDAYHLAIFSNNVIAVAVVVASAAKNAVDSRRLVFHVVTDRMYLPAMRVWFKLRPPPGHARIEIRSLTDFSLGRQDLDLFTLRFYLPAMYPELRRIVLLEDDVVVQRDLADLWRVDLEGRVNGAVEMCFGGFRRFDRYLNFSHPVVAERFSPRVCAWSFGVNVFDLDAWRREHCTDRFQEYQSLNEDGILWKPEAVLPAGLMTFYMTTTPLDKSWHVMGLGYNPSVNLEEIHNAAVIHFNGNMKPWLDVAMNQYKQLWTKYVDTEMEFLPLCNFGV
ncbi:probable galacturonosyltransferase 9 [Dioscorea cayenensis subsp. rotundata]|uniref:Hexosyltransferase n=1 Tax=Dioscorea cayennensis subsp. rotundata TaxID=55577 RepID=A0AB40AJV8_DIOCR|nr:probable galacturonosyltransferase 9 [Dioscorea cayenensis subsp. rotundata]